MGMEHRVQIPSGTPVSWSAIRQVLSEVGEKPVLRMIDAELAFPDELPPEEWTELRIALSGGMVTLRRHSESVACITWGNADEALTDSWNKTCWAVATATQGAIVSTLGELSADEFGVQHSIVSI